MHRRLFLIFLLIPLLVLSACDAAADDNDSDDTNEQAIVDDTYEIALVMKTLTNPFFIEMEKGAREAEEDLGINLYVRTAAQETSIEQQIDIIEDLIQDEVDAIVIAPGDSEALIPVLKRAQDNGIVIVNIDNQLSLEVSERAGLENVPFISVDNVEGAYLAAQYLVKDVDEPTQAIILEGIRAAQNAQDRLTGARQALEENENIEIVATETANWKIDEAYSVTGQLFEQYPDVGIIYASNDIMALGAIQWLKDNDRTDVIVGGYDALEEARDAIRADELVVTINQQAAQQGYLGVEYAVNILNGEIPDMLTYVDVLVVTQETLE